MTTRPLILTIYLFVVAVGAFLLPAEIKAVGVVTLILLQIGILAICGKLSWRAVTILWRLKFLFLFFILINAFLPSREAGRGEPIEQTIGLHLGGQNRSDLDRQHNGGGNHRHRGDQSGRRQGGARTSRGIHLNPSGLALGLLMCAQIILVVLTSYVVRTVGEKNAFIKGLTRLKITPLLAYSLDSTLAMLDGDEGHGGGGGGGGGGRRRRERASAGEEKESKHRGGLIAVLRSGNLGPFYEKVGANLERSRKRAQELGLDANRAHDVGVIAGIGAVMMAFKLLKIMPGIPFAPGAKTIFFIPLYILGADLTRTRWGATVAGAIMGLIAFLNGDGRYGIFEVMKHIMPGLCIDLLWPIFRRLPRKIWVLSLLGLAAAIARTSTELLITIAVGARAELYVFPAFKLAPNMIAGVLSGFVTYPLLTRLGAAIKTDGNPDEPIQGDAKHGSEETINIQTSMDPMDEHHEREAL